MKITNVEYSLHSIYLVIEGFLKSLNKFLFVGAGAFLVPIFYGISFFDNSMVTNAAVVIYWLLLSIFICVFSLAVKKTYVGAEVSFYYYFMLLMSLGGAIFAMSFAEYYEIKEQNDYKLINVFFYAAINTLIWKFLFYIIKFARFLLIWLSKKEAFRKMFSQITIENLLSLFFVLVVIYHISLSVYYLVT